MIKVIAHVILACSAILASPDTDTDIEPCTFQAHTTVGTVSGKCGTQQLSLPGYHSRWALTLQFDTMSTTLARQLKPDRFADMVRTQSVENGTDIIVLGLWGDLEVIPTDPEYLDQLKAKAPLYETRPNLITITQTRASPLTLQLLFEEPADYLNLETRRPSIEWWNEYLRSYYRLGTNRPTGFSGSDSTGGNRALKGPATERPRN
jgi:hypothetical protein